MRKTAVIAVTALALTGCGSPAHASPPSASAIARSLGCHVTGPDADPIAAYDTRQYVQAGGAPDCPAVIITFRSLRDERDWDHRERIALSGAGYSTVEFIQGRLWAVAGNYSRVPHALKALGGRQVAL